MNVTARTVTIVIFSKQHNVTIARKMTFPKRMSLNYPATKKAQGQRILGLETTLTVTHQNVINQSATMKILTVIRISQIVTKKAQNVTKKTAILNVTARSVTVRLS